MPGTFFPPSRVSDPDIHHGTCMTHVPWCMLGSLTSGSLWSRWRGKRSRYSQRTRNRQFYVSVKRPMPRLLFTLASHALGANSATENRGCNDANFVVMLARIDVPVGDNKVDILTAEEFQCAKLAGAVSLRICRLPSKAIHIIQMRGSWDRLVLLMGIIKTKESLYIETGPRRHGHDTRFFVRTAGSRKVHRI